MFTGIIEEVGRIRSVKNQSLSCVLSIQAKEVLTDIHVGDSIAVNGVCLTVTSFDSTGFMADVMHETLNRSSMANIRANTPVNLERAMAACGRFGGHIVSGHIDGTGELVNIKKDGIAVWLTVRASSNLLRYIVEKGSVALDGISLTVATASKDTFQVSVIPHTFEATALGTKRIGDKINIENDIIGKYVERFFKEESLKQNRNNGGGTITKNMLTEYGF